MPASWTLSLENWEKPVYKLLCLQDFVLAPSLEEDMDFLTEIHLL